MTGCSDSTQNYASFGKRFFSEKVGHSVKKSESKANLCILFSRKSNLDIFLPKKKKKKIRKNSKFNEIL